MTVPERAPAPGEFHVVFRARRIAGVNGETSGSVGVRDGEIAARDRVHVDVGFWGGAVDDNA
ncbi:hypothetical protein [Streptomyces winkii]|uniref:hypothetical protein n=1 Tax=Streptomyces winkii TaxID=3051178 RepID=UPI0028D82F3E|nr:hypothetical protein [Streptomyces sp. DSM 40971]